MNVRQALWGGCALACAVLAYFLTRPAETTTSAAAQADAVQQTPTTTQQSSSPNNQQTAPTAGSLGKRVPTTLKGAPRRYAGSSPKTSSSSKTVPLRGRELAQRFPKVMTRIQEGLREENGAAIRACLGSIAAPPDTNVSFEVTIDVAIDGEVGTVRSVAFPEAPEELSDENKACLDDVMSSLSFNGLDVAFEGPVSYPFVVRGAPAAKAE